MGPNFKTVEPYARPQAIGYSHHSRKEPGLGGEVETVCDALPNLTYLNGQPGFPTPDRYQVVFERVLW